MGIGRIHGLQALKLLQFLLAEPLLKDRLIRDCRSRVHNLINLRDKYEYSGGQTKGEYRCPSGDDRTEGLFFFPSSSDLIPSGGNVRQAAGELVDDLEEAIRDYDIRNPEENAQRRKSLSSKSKSKKRNGDVLQPIDSEQMQKLFQDSSFKQQPASAAEIPAESIDAIFDVNQFAQVG